MLWISLGPTPDIQSELLRLAELVQVPEQQRTQEHTREEWLQHIHHAIGVRRLLIIIDDAWSVSAIQSFIFESRQVAYLITTRLPGVAFALSRGEVYLIPELNEQQSRQLLEHQVPLFQYVAEDLVQQVLQICGGLPLALTLLNRTLRRESVGGQYRRVQAVLLRLIERRQLHQLIVPSISVILRPPSEEPILLKTMIDLSIQYVVPNVRSAFFALSILPTKPENFSEEAGLAVCQQNITVLDELLDAGLLEGAGQARYCMHQVLAEYGRQHQDDNTARMRLIH